MVLVHAERDGHDEHGGDSLLGRRDYAESRIGQIPQGNPSGGVKADSTESPSWRTNLGSPKW